MRSIWQETPSRRRLGITLIEVLVVITILATLAALMLPATRSARISSRRVQCQSNLRNVNLAVQAYSTAHRGAVPPLSGGFTIAVQNRSISAPWTVHLLPYLECNDTYDQLQYSLSTKTDQLAQRSIESYLCPDMLNRPEGGLSYVANAGVIASSDWARADSSTHRMDRFDFVFNGYREERLTSEDQDLARSTGVFWRAPLDGATSKQLPLTLDEISQADGTSQTISLSENLHTRSYDPKTQTGGWVSDATGDIAFGIAVSGYDSVGRFHVFGNDAPGGLGVAGGPIATGLQLSRDPVPEGSRINANRNDAVFGASPRPASNHSWGVNVAFADGSCRFLSEEIDPAVYARLLSPAGSRFGQLPVNQSDF